MTTQVQFRVIDGRGPGCCRRGGLLRQQRAEFITGTSLLVDGRMTAGYHQHDHSPLAEPGPDSRHRCLVAGSGPDQLVDGEERELWCYVLGLLDGGKELLAGECLELLL